MDDKVRELLDRVRDTAVGAADAANQTARAAGKKAGQMVDVAKLNVQLFDLNGEFNDVLRQLGQVMYDTHRGQAEDGEQITALLASGAAGEVVMVAGYFLYEAAPVPVGLGLGALANVPFNLVQGVFGLVSAGAVYLALFRTRALARL